MIINWTYEERGVRDMGQRREGDAGAKGITELVREEEEVGFLSHFMGNMLIQSK
jgi:hypothetical protein